MSGIDCGIKSATSKLNMAASYASSNPLQSVTLGMEASLEAKASAKAIQARDENLGQIIDLFA